MHCTTSHRLEREEIRYCTSEGLQKSHSKKAWTQEIRHYFYVDDMLTCAFLVSVQEESSNVQIFSQLVLYAGVWTQSSAVKSLFLFVKRQNCGEDKFFRFPHTSQACAREAFGRVLKKTTQSYRSRFLECCCVGTLKTCLS